jgi:hypothetical protein
VAQLYKYYQLIGGTEDWHLTKSDADLTAASPTFTTILALDTLGTLPADKPTRELLDSAKYYGPMYFDLDSVDVEDSITDANWLIDKLFSEGLQATDIDIFLSGKKGLHILISPVVFMEKQVPLQYLPAIYKEIAYKLATDTTDYKVYTARSGRMLRTCYNIRENNNYRVPITVAELRGLNAESYKDLCRSKRVVAVSTPVFRAAFALIYDAAKQKVARSSHKKAKPIDAKTIQLHLPIIQKIMAGEVVTGAGFNNIAIQVAIYARDAGMSENALIANCAGLINSHNGDGNRYNTPSKREAEIRRMAGYVEANTSYEYAVGPMKALLPKGSVEPQYDSEGELVDSDNTEAFSNGVSIIGKQYVSSKGDAGDVPISNFIFTSIVKLITIKTQEIVGIKATLTGVDRDLLPITLSASHFTGSSSLHSAVSIYGGSFTGSDIHARGVLQIMLHKCSDTRYIIDSEGVNVINVPTSEHIELRNPFVVWADGAGVRAPSFVTDTNTKFEFSGDPDPEGVMKTDLTLAPTIWQYIEAETGNKQLVRETLKALFASQESDAIGKLVGWMVATFWRQQFHIKYHKFPLLHIYGPAGLGKSEMTFAMLRMFYYKQQAQMLTPASTPFSFLQSVGGSSSIPVMLDEYKPAKMNPVDLEKFRAIFRGAYNMHDTQRGGGNRTKSSFNALSRISMSGPIVFVAEAPETENAIADRSVLVSFRKPSAARFSSNFANYMKMMKGVDILTSIGHSVATQVVHDTHMDSFYEKFESLHNKVIDKMIAKPEEEHTMTPQEFLAKKCNSPRMIFNTSVAMFGLLRLKALVKDIFKSEFEEHFEADFAAMQSGVMKGSSDGVVNMSPEYIKVLTSMGDMSQLSIDDRLRLVEGQDYNLSEIGGMPVLALAPRAAYHKYRGHCKQSGMEYYFHNEHSFIQAMREIPQYLRAGKGTTRVQVDTLIFDLDELQRSGVSKWSGKNVTLP